MRVQFFNGSLRRRDTPAYAWYGAALRRRDVLSNLSVDKDSGAKHPDAGAGRSNTQPHLFHRED